MARPRNPNSDLTRHDLGELLVRETKDLEARGKEDDGRTVGSKAEMAANDVPSPQTVCMVAAEMCRNSRLFYWLHVPSHMLPHIPSTQGSMLIARRVHGFHINIQVLYLGR